jgi:L-seryl-tRNA(Ser) seleniumtransferase
VKENVKSLPSVDQILNLESTTQLLLRYRRDYVTTAVRQVLQALRQELIQAAGTHDSAADGEPAAGIRGALVTRVEAMIALALGAREQASIHRVINATGVILHTGLGRAPLPAVAVAAVCDVAESYCNLELDLESGERGSRLVHIEPLICELSGGEAAVVVNNNAGAVLLMLSVLARGREVIISRGELVEIGGSFRIPDIIAASGATIREVGTTNRTHLRDFEGAISDKTGLILAVHPSNYKVEGFTSGVDLARLVELGKRYDVAVAYDLGGGALVDVSEWGLPSEPVVGQALATGVDVVSFSGDKVLGGPQAGIIVGRASRVEAMRTHPMMRALRCDKLILAALEATLKLYNRPAGEIAALHPVLRMLCESADLTRARADRLLSLFPQSVRVQLSAQVEASMAQAGSGALPLEQLPSWALSLVPDFCTVEVLGQRLRSAPVPIVGRIQKDRLLLDMRTVFDRDLETVASTIEAVVAVAGA